MKYLLILCLFLVSCGGDPTKPRPTPTPWPTVTPRPSVTPIPTPRPTATPQPTATPRPTPAPIQKRSLLVKWKYEGINVVSFKLYFGVIGGAELGPKSVGLVYETNTIPLELWKRHYFIIDAILDNGEERFSTAYDCTPTQTGCIK